MRLFLGWNELMCNHGIGDSCNNPKSASTPSFPHCICKTPFQLVRLQLHQRYYFLPLLIFFITSGILTKRKVGMSVHTFFSFATFNFFVLLKPMLLDLLRKINGHCLNSLLLIYLFYYHDERTILYFYLLPMNKDFFFQIMKWSLYISTVKDITFSFPGLVITDCFHTHHLILSFILVNSWNKWQY